jgi:hypothetical protein
MKCTMIVAAAAATSPMAMADLASCAAAQVAMVGDTSCVATAESCPAAYQGLVDTVYKECGGLEEGGIEWDTTSGPGIKTLAEVCKCSGAEMAAPVFALAAAAMAFFA